MAKHRFLDLSDNETRKGLASAERDTVALFAAFARADAALRAGDLPALAAEVSGIESFNMANVRSNHKGTNVPAFVPKRLAVYRRALGAREGV